MVNIPAAGCLTTTWRISNCLRTLVRSPQLEAPFRKWSFERNSFDLKLSNVSAWKHSRKPVWFSTTSSSIFERCPLWKPDSWIQTTRFSSFFRFSRDWLPSIKICLDIIQMTRKQFAKNAVYRRCMPWVILIEYIQWSSVSNKLGKRCLARHADMETLNLQLRRAFTKCIHIETNSLPVHYGRYGWHSIWSLPDRIYQIATYR